MFARYAVVIAAAISAQGTSEPISTDQISRGEAVVPAPAAAQANANADQVTSTEQGRQPLAQLERANRSAAAAPQLMPARPNAQAPFPLSSSKDSRPRAAERLAGTDRCDQKNQSKEMADKCAAIIENRAAAFVRPEAPELSPEQKIIIEQSEMAKKDLEAAARRLANTGDDMDSIEAQGVAFVVLKPVVREEEKPEDKPSEDEAAAINAILNPGPPQ